MQTVAGMNGGEGAGVHGFLRPDFSEGDTNFVQGVLGVGARAARLGTSAEFLAYLEGIVLQNASLQQQVDQLQDAVRDTRRKVNYLESQLQNRGLV